MGVDCRSLFGCDSNELSFVEDFTLLIAISTSHILTGLGYLSLQLVVHSGLVCDKEELVAISSLLIDMTSEELKQTLSVEDCVTALAYSMFIDPDDIEAVEALLIKWSSPVITRDSKPALRADRDNTLSDMAAVSNVQNFHVGQEEPLQYAALRLHMGEWRAGKYVYDNKSYQALIDMFNGGIPLEEHKENIFSVGEHPQPHDPDYPLGDFPEDL